MSLNLKPTPRNSYKPEIHMLGHIRIKSHPKQPPLSSLNMAGYISFKVLSTPIPNNTSVYLITPICNTSRTTLSPSYIKVQTASV